MTKKGNIWYIHDFSKAVGNTIKASCRFNAAAIAYFWYFNNNMFSVVTNLACNKVIVSSIQVSTLQTFAPFATFLFLRRSRKEILILKFLLKIHKLLKAIKFIGLWKDFPIKC